MWATQYLELDSWHQLITSGGLGTMGFGLPAAIGAKIGNPDKEVVCFPGMAVCRMDDSGDGDGGCAGGAGHHLRV